MMDDDNGIYAVVAEFKGEAPLLMETSGDVSSRERAEERRRSLLDRPDVIRVCVVRIVPAKWGGNDLLLKDMERMQS